MRRTLKPHWLIYIWHMCCSTPDCLLCICVYLNLNNHNFLRVFRFLSIYVWGLLFLWLLRFCKKKKILVRGLLFVFCVRYLPVRLLQYSYRFFLLSLTVIFSLSSVALIRNICRIFYFSQKTTQIMGIFRWQVVVCAVLQGCQFHKIKIAKFVKVVKLAGMSHTFDNL